jgi:hypothetical protein
MVYGASFSGIVMVHSPGEGVISGLISFSFARSILFRIWSNKFLKSILIYSFAFAELVSH